MDPAGLLAALPQPALLVGADGRIAAANAAAEALFALGLAGRHHVAALRRPELLDAIGQARTGHGLQVARLPMRQDGQERIWSVTAGPAGPAGPAVAAPPPPVLLIFEDATRDEAAARIRREFVANVSHELKTPLTALLGFIETLRGPARDDGRARDRFLAVMEREARRMDRLVSDLLVLGRVEEEERLRPREQVALKALAGRTLAAMRTLLEGAGGRVELDLPEAEVIVPGDADQIQQVLSNLIENAVKYGRPRGTVRIALLPPAPDPVLGVPAASLSVTDEGEGIDSQHLPRLTERFYRVDSHRSRASGGTGLGLAIVKHIVSRHRGRMKIISEAGIGSTFSVLLPAGADGGTGCG